MGKKNCTVEQITVKLREIEVLCSQEKRLVKRSGKRTYPNRRITVGGKYTVGWTRLTQSA